jgi:hypothetical protein
MTTATERLHFKIGISATYWDKQPYIIIGVDNKPYYLGYITTPSDEITYIEFDADVADGEHQLELVFNNKQSSDTVKDNYQDPDNYTIVKDMLVNIHSVEIDELDLGQMTLNESIFKLSSPVEFNGKTTNEIERCVNLGFNGAWTLNFNSPFYIWLLEKL